MIAIQYFSCYTDKKCGAISNYKNLHFFIVALYAKKLEITDFCTLSLLHYVGEMHGVFFCTCKSHISAEIIRFHENKIIPTLVKIASSSYNEQENTPKGGVQWIIDKLTTTG